MRRLVLWPRVVGALLVVMMVVMLLASPATWAQTATLNELLQNARDARERSASDDPNAQADWPADAQQQRARIDALAQTLGAERARSQALNDAFTANDQAISAARAHLAAKLGELDGVLDVARAAAADVRGVLATSVVSAELTDRSARLAALEQDQRVPALAELQDFALLLHEEMTAQANVARFEARVFDAAGFPADAQVVRLGAFGLVAGDRFLTYDAPSQSLRAPARQPAARYRAAAAQLTAANAGLLVAPLDPTRGELLDTLGRAPGPAARATQAGPVGYLILALGAFGALIAIWRAWVLALSGRRIARQLGDPTARSDNALGRIMSVCHETASALPGSAHTLERQLDEAIAREVPLLERWQGAVRIVAAVAPLLGLLGTVIGMIETFQSISVYGSNEPQRMADGISKALSTTMLGLIVAIPMVLLHAVIASMSRRQIDILESHTAGLIARRSEAS